MKNLLLTLIIALIALNAKAQQNEPTIMILPSDNWCFERSFITKVNNQGAQVKFPNYKEAFQEDTELAQVIAKIGELMLQKGIRLKDVEQELKNLDQRRAEDNVTVSKTSSSTLNETNLDILKRRVKADILVQLWWEVNNTSNGNVIRYTLDAFDSYSGKRVASSTGNSSGSNKFVPDLILKSVKSNSNLFFSQIKNYFKDIQSNGREVVIKVNTWDNLKEKIDLENEYNDIELSNHIKNWMRKNTVNGKFSTMDMSETSITFEQVRIPLKNESGDSMDARDFLNNLRIYLKAPPFNLPTKLMTRGLGEAILVIGEK